ncbi:MAG: hypothetical protein IKF82_00865 [Bacilli bacterium]|nr:hypothetical protein [Bacilli bacterium]
MLNIIQNLENHNANLIDIAAYNEFLNKVIDREEPLTDDEIKIIMTEAFIAFSRVPEVRQKYAQIKNDRNKLAKLFDDAPYDIKSQILDMYCLCRMSYNWLRYKQIYKFDPDTLKLLSENKQKITNEVLENLNLPYDHFAIENEFKLSDGNIDSVLVRKDGGEYTFYLFYKEDKKLFRHAILQFSTKKLDFEEFIKDADKDFVYMYTTLFNMLMYLAQPKVEILKKKSEIKQRKNPKHFYSLSYEENEVGYSLGAAIRNYKYVYEHSESHNIGSSKRPHMRCGHFHHYWTGEGRKKLIVKFVEPTFVKGSSAKTPTLRKVK